MEGEEGHVYVCVCLVSRVRVIGDGVQTTLEFKPCFHYREVLMQDSSASKDSICSTISSLPCQLSAEDIDDFFSLAQYYASRTPQSFRKVGMGLMPAEMWVWHYARGFPQSFRKWVQVVRECGTYSSGTSDR